MSPQQEAEIGREAAAEVEDTLGLIETGALTSYTSAVGQRLAAYSPRKDVGYRFYVVDMLEPNAFALPGGYIYLSRGLLALVNSEAELANVIGHEIGHVAARHAAQRQTRATGVGILTVLGTVLAGAAGGAEAAQAASELGQIAGAGLIAAYSRDQEREADAIGQQLAAQAGYDPRSMATFLDTLEKYTALHEGATTRPSYFASHPALSERVTRTAGRAGTLTTVAQPPVADRAGMLMRFDGLIVGNDPAQGLFRDTLFLHPKLNLALQFPGSWATVNQRDVVAGQSSDRRALITMHLVGPSRDPRLAGQEFIERHGVNVAQARNVTIGGHRAFQIAGSASTQQGELGVLITWIDHPSGVMRITGVTPVATFTTFEDVFSKTAASFRSLRNEERMSVTERRLRSSAARSGESLQALGQRSKNHWSLEETAIVNGLRADTSLSSGQLIKITVEQRYQP